MSGVLDAMVSAGKVRVIVVSNFDAGLQGCVLDLIGLPQVEGLLPDQCVVQDVGVVTYFSLASASYPASIAGRWT